MNENAAASNPSSSSTTLKRPRQQEIPAQPPPLPKINSELILQVFTHVSLRRATANPEEYGDNERLIGLGRMALDAAVTYATYSRRPMLTAEEIIPSRDKVLSDATFKSWEELYGLRRRLRCHPDVFPKLGAPEELRNIVHAYIGGLYADRGPGVVQEWISDLLDYDAPDGSPPRARPQQRLEPGAPQPQPRIETPPPQKRIKSEQWSPLPQASPAIFFASQPPPSPVLRQTPPHMHARAQFHSQPFHYPQQQSYGLPPPHAKLPPLKPPAARPNPLAPAQPNLPFLPLFNQTATQRRVTVEYPAEFSGPSHAGMWTVKCVVNGIPKGVGSGSSKQVAKEEAARQAYYAMGWT